MDVPSSTKDFSEFAALVREAGVGMVVTSEDDGTLRSRPLATEGVDADGTLWFMTARDSPKSGEVAREHHVCVNYAAHNRFASISGSALLVDDRAKLRELWKGDQAAFFDGPDDPKLVLLRVRTAKAELWDGDRKLAFTRSRSRV